MRLAIITVVVFLCGCSARDDLRPLVAAAGAYGLVEAGNGPQPNPSPKPGVCETCGGSGWLGDGTIRTPCPSCSKECKDGKCPTPSTRR